MKNEKIEIDVLISKFLSGEATPEEAVYLEEWKNESIDNNTYYSVSAKTFSLISNTKLLDGIDVDAAWKKNATFLDVPDTVSKSGLARYIYIGISIIILLGLYYFLNKASDKAVIYQSMQFAMSETLEDGSKTVLEPRSSLFVERDFGINTRTVSLTGSAEFEVEHNDDIPFIVEVENVFVEDLGTKFKINSSPDSDTIFVVVEEGVVRLYDALGNEIIIKAGEKAWYIKSQKLIVTDFDTQVVQFDFNNTTLTDAIILIEKAYEVNIILEPVLIGNCTITTTFFDEDVETMIAVISETLDFNYSGSDDNYTIKGRPCIEVE